MSLHVMPEMKMLVVPDWACTRLLQGLDDEPEAEEEALADGLRDVPDQLAGDRLDAQDPHDTPRPVLMIVLSVVGLSISAVGSLHSLADACCCSSSAAGSSCGH